jgi:hypothetical protein
MAFTITPGVEVERDREGVVRQLQHLQVPYTVPEGLRATPEELAGQYLREVAPIYGIDSSWLTSLGTPPEDKLTAEGVMLHISVVNPVMETTVVSYVETDLALPIWEAGVTVVAHNNPLRVTSSQSSVHFNVKTRSPGPDARFLPDRIDSLMLAHLLGVQEVPPKINSARLRIYRYDPASRFDPESAGKQEPGMFQQGPPVLPLPPVPRDIIVGEHHVVSEVLFSLPVIGWGELNWRAFVDVEFGSVLYLRAFVACATGMVYETDALTATGNVAILPSSSNAVLNPLRTPVTLPDITPAGAGMPQALTGAFVQLSDFSPPAIAPPTELTGNFAYDVATDNFSAVNAYYHCDSLFQLVQGMGFTIPSYFPGTNTQPGFPVPVDHRGTVGGCSDCVNAQAPGNVAGTGLGAFIFALEEAGTLVGIADDPRVVAHEFGHALLWNRVHSPNFGFAHSHGDSLAVILNDPASQAPDRFESFPWITLGTPGISRRHDRSVAGGWAWGGVKDIGGYSSEQILSTTHFRIYRSCGGDDTRLAVRQLASRYLVYLIVRATASLGPTPITPTPTPGLWATALMNADTGSANFEGQPGGAYAKVIRWGFEKQGLYQPAGAPAPVTTEGAPPAVDVYIDDGRHGEYPYLQGFWENTDIWNRLAADGGTTHQTPIVSVTNYAYVRVKNRGTQPATNVTLNGYHCKPSAGLVWPDDWQAMTTAQLPAGGPIPSGGETIVGPFQWTPSEIGHECMLMSASATGDLSNIDLASLLPCAAGPTQHWRLVPFDNNIGQRNVAPVAGGGGGFNLSKSFEHRHFWMNNPFDRTVHIKLETVLPDFLQQRNWQLRFLNPGGRAFTLGPRGSREILLSLVPGQDFSRPDVEQAGKDTTIAVLALAEGALIGGMSYKVDPELKSPAQERPEKPEDCTDAAKRLLDCLSIQADQVKKVRIKSVTVEIKLDEDC